MICPTCKGSGTNPPGSPIYAYDNYPFHAPDDVPRFTGWSYLSNNTAPIPACETCNGTGRSALNTGESDG